MAAISPFNFLAVLDGKAQAPERISPDLTMPAFEDALANMLGSQADNANGDENTEAPPTAAPTLGLPTDSRLTLDPPLNGVPTGPETEQELPQLELTSAEAPLPDAADAEPAEDEALLVNPQACFVTLPWLPTPKGEQPPVSVPASREVATTRRSTLRFPPPPEAQLQAAQEPNAAQPQSDARPAEEPIGSKEKAPALAPSQKAQAAPRAVEPGLVVAPSFIEGGRVEWTIEAPPTPANDTHRSMSYAVAAAEHEQRTLRSDEARPAAKRDRATVATPGTEPVREPRDSAERARAIEPSAEITRAPGLFTTAAAPEAPAFAPPAQAPRNDAGFEQRVSASVAALPDHRMSEASRERRQDDAEVTVSQMTLSHRVEARTTVDELGVITVRADIRDGQVEMTVAADRVETAAFLDQNRADLSRDLKIAAPTVSDVSVRTGEGGNGSRREQPQRQAHDGWGSGTPTSMAAATTDTRAITANGKRVRIVL